MTYDTLLLPNRWPEFRRQLGAHYLARADQSLHARAYAEALHLLRSGLAKDPGNRPGRLQLASLYERAGRPDLARDVLADGWRLHRHDATYVRARLGYLSRNHANPDILALADDWFRSQDSHDQELDKTIALHAAQAANALGRPEQAESLIRRHSLHLTPEGSLLLARIEWSHGLPELALNRLADLSQQHPDYAPARLTTAEFQRHLGRTQAWETTVVALLASAPLETAPRIEYLRLLQHRGEQSRLDQESAAFLHLFRHDPAALLQLAGFAVESARPELAQAATALIPVESGQGPAAGLLLAEACLAAGRPAEAMSALDTHHATPPPPDSPLAPAYYSLRATAAQALHRSDEAHLHLTQLLALPRVQAETLTLTARRLRQLQAGAPARLALTRALQLDPLHREAHELLLAQAIEDDDAAALIATLDTYLQLRNPSPDLLGRARDILNSDRHLLLDAQARTLTALNSRLGAAR